MVLVETVAASTSYTVYAFNLSLHFPLGDLHGSQLLIFVDGYGDKAFCERDSTNFNANGTVIASSTLAVLCRIWC